MPWRRGAPDDAVQSSPGLTAPRAGVPAGEPARERPPPADLVLRHETADDLDAVEALYAAAFGPGRFTRTSYRIRGTRAHDPQASFVAERGAGQRAGHEGRADPARIIGAIRQTRVTVGGAPAFLLGPLAVAETAAKQGIGRALLTRSIEAARATRAHAIVLVGDEPFYRPSGFVRVPRGEVVMPGPVEAHRLLVLTLRRAVTGPLAAGDWPDYAPGANDIGDPSS